MLVASVVRAKAKAQIKARPKAGSPERGKGSTARRSSSPAAPTKASLKTRVSKSVSKHVHQSHVDLESGDPLTSGMSTAAGDEPIENRHEPHLENGSKNEAGAPSAPELFFVPASASEESSEGISFSSGDVKHRSSTAASRSKKARIGAASLPSSQKERQADVQRVMQLVRSKSSPRLSEMSPWDDCAVLCERHSWAQRRVVCPSHAQPGAGRLLCITKRMQLQLPLQPKSDSMGDAPAISPQSGSQRGVGQVEFQRPSVAVPNIEESAEFLASAVSNAVTPGSDQISLRVEIRLGTLTLFPDELQELEIEGIESGDARSAMSVNLASSARKAPVWKKLEVGPFCPLLDGPRMGQLHRSLLSDASRILLSSLVNETFFQAVVRLDGDSDGHAHSIAQYRVFERTVSQKKWTAVNYAVPAQVTVPGANMDISVSVAAVTRCVRGGATEADEALTASLDAAISAVTEMVGVPTVTTQLDESLKSSNTSARILSVSVVRSSRRIVLLGEQGGEAPSSPPPLPGVSMEPHLHEETITTHDFTGGGGGDGSVPIVSETNRAFLTLGTSWETVTSVGALKITTFTNSLRLVAPTLNKLLHARDGPYSATESPVPAFVAPAEEKLEVCTDIVDLAHTFHQPTPQEQHTPVLHNEWLAKAIARAELRFPRPFVASSLATSEASNPADAAKQAAGGLLCVGRDWSTHSTLVKELEHVMGQQPLSVQVDVAVANHAGLVIKATMDTKSSTVGKCAAYYVGENLNLAEQMLFRDDLRLKMLDDGSLLESVEGTDVRLALVAADHRDPGDADEECDTMPPARELATQGYPKEVAEMVSIYKAVLHDSFYTIGTSLSRGASASRVSQLGKSLGTNAPFGPHSGGAPPSALSLAKISFEKTIRVDAVCTLKVCGSTLIDLVASHTRTRVSYANAYFVPAESAVPRQDFTDHVKTAISSLVSRSVRLRGLLPPAVRADAASMAGFDNKSFATLLNSQSFGRMHADFLGTVSGSTALPTVDQRREMSQRPLLMELYDAAAQSPGDGMVAFQRGSSVWLKNLAAVGVITIADLEELARGDSAVVTLKGCGIPEIIIEQLLADGNQLPCGTRRLFPSRRVTSLGASCDSLVGVKLMQSLQAPFGRRREGDTVLVGMATPSVAQACVDRFGIDNVGLVDRTLLVVNDHPICGTELLLHNDKAWDNIENLQLVRFSTDSGSVVPLVRRLQGEDLSLRPLTSSERSLFYHRTTPSSPQPVVVSPPRVGAPLFLHGRLGIFYGRGPQRLASVLLNGATARSLRPKK